MDLFADLIDNIFDGICQIDAECRVIVWSKGAERITGFPAKTVIGTDIRTNMIRYVLEDNREISQTDTPLLGTLKDGVKRVGITFVKHADGYRVSTLARTFPIHGKKDRIEGAVLVFSDHKGLIAAHHQNQRVDQTVLFDALTGIGNRSHIETKVKFAIEDSQTHGISFGILFIDIDHFKQFNDTHGHLTGDKILRVVANTLRHNLRFTDSCGRWGGEEFLALVMDTQKEGLEIAAEKLRALVAASGLEEDGKNLNVTISIGGTLAQPQDTLQTLLKRADELLYKSKQAGRNRATIDG